MGETLTPREMEVALLICDHMTFDEIAERLGISSRTVKVYSDNARYKLGVSKKREIPGAMRRLGLY